MPPCTVLIFCYSTNVASVCRDEFAAGPRCGQAGGRAVVGKGWAGGGSGQDSMEVAVASSSRALSCLAQEHSHAAQAIDVVVIGVGA